MTDVPVSSLASVAAFVQGPLALVGRPQTSDSHAIAVRRLRRFSRTSRETAPSLETWRFVATVAAMKRTASAVWQGNLKQGKGALSTESTVLNQTQYSFSTRFENGRGTNPEELIAAAHAGCFTMALSAALEKAGHVAGRLATNAAVTLEQVGGNWTISTIHLELTGSVPGIDQAGFEAIAADAKANCPVSRVLNAKITLSAKLEPAS